MAADMQIWRGGERVPPGPRGAVIGIGNFDGVHRGHGHLVSVVRERAAASRRPAAVLTFEPHPRSFFAPQVPLFRLTPEPVKLKLLARLGLDAVFVMAFDASLAATTAEDFVGKLLVEALGASAIVVGEDFHFGRGRQGTPALLRELCERHGLGYTLIGAVREDGRTISSSAIRAALAGGEVAHANDLLGYRWLVQGEVLHGDKRGRHLGYATANLSLGPHCLLRHGIYAVRAALGAGEVRDGVASFGRRPTFDDGAPLLEVHLFDFAGDLYGRRIEVEFLAWIRGEERFASPAALVARMDADSAEARRVLRAGSEIPSVIG
jgi:riboflavin kinase/FMN adenylyltransferase